MLEAVERVARKIDSIPHIKPPRFAYTRVGATLFLLSSAVLLASCQSNTENTGVNPVVNGFNRLFNTDEYVGPTDCQGSLAWKLIKDRLRKAKFDQPLKGYDLGTVKVFNETTCNPPDVRDQAVRHSNVLACNAWITWDEILRVNPNISSRNNPVSGKEALTAHKMNHCPAQPKAA